MAEHEKRVLIVEDDYLIADDLATGFVEAGFSIEGPVASLAEALALVETGQTDGALLDINLDGEKVWEVADALAERGVPIVFVTGYDRESIPAKYGKVPLCLKPVDLAKVVEALTRAHQVRSPAFHLLRSVCTPATCNEVGAAEVGRVPAFVPSQADGDDGRGVHALVEERPRLVRSSRASGVSRLKHMLAFISRPPSANQMDASISAYLPGFPVELLPTHKRS